MHVLEAIQTKRAVRRFSQTPLPDPIVSDILNAGRRSQSAKNTQPWRFIAVRQRERLENLSEVGTYAGHIAGAALAVAILTPDPQQRWSILFDAGQAAAYMQLAGWAHGVASCPATVYEPEAARRVLGHPPDWHLHLILSFGFPQDPQDINRPPAPGGRRPFQETVFFEQWNQAG